MKTTRENKVKFVMCAGGGVGKLHVRRNHKNLGVDIHGLEWWRGFRKSTSAGHVSGLWPRVGRAVMCKCWALHWTMRRFWQNHAVGVVGFPRRPRKSITGVVCRGGPDRLGQVSDPSCGWGSWPTPQPGRTNVRDWPSGLSKRLQAGPQQTVAC